MTGGVKGQQDIQFVCGIHALSVHADPSQWQGRHSQLSGEHTPLHLHQLVSFWCMTHHHSIGLIHQIIQVDVSVVVYVCV